MHNKQGKQPEKGFKTSVLAVPEITETAVVKIKQLAISSLHIDFPLK